MMIGPHRSHKCSDPTGVIPYETTSDPGVTNDIVDSAAIGRVFKKGDFWRNTSTNILWICESNTTGAANWVNANETKGTTNQEILHYNTSTGRWEPEGGNILVGDLPTGTTDGYGITTPGTSKTLGLVSTRSSGANNISVDVVADVNNATIDADHKIATFSYLNNSNARTEVASLKPNVLELTGTSSAALLSTDLNSPSVTAVTLGTENVFTIPSTVSGLTASRATLVSVVNGVPGNEKFSIDVTGNVTFNELPNGQKSGLYSLSEELSLAAAASTDTTYAIIPSGVQVTGVSTIVTSPIPSGITYDVGVVGATTRYGTKLCASTGCNWKGTEDAVRNYQANTPIRITPSTTLGMTEAKVRVTIHYIEITAPTS